MRIDPGVPLEPWHNMVHRESAHVRIGIVCDDLTLDEMRILKDLRSVVDRTDRDLRRLEEGDVLRLRPLGDEGTDDRINASAFLTRLALVRNVGSSMRSGRPMDRNSRSAIFWIEAERLTYLPSLQR